MNVQMNTRSEIVASTSVVAAY